MRHLRHAGHGNCWIRKRLRNGPSGLSLLKILSQRKSGRGAEAESDQPRRTDAGRKRYHKRLSPYPDLNAIKYEDSQTVWYRRCATNGKQYLMPSGCEALVAVVQPADVRDGDDAAARRWLDGTRVRTILVE
jgi:hypothetical protein